MDRILLLTEAIGWENVRLFFTHSEEQSGGSFTLCPKDDGSSYIDLIGNDQDKLLEALYHEVVELTITRMGCRLAPSPEMTGGHDTYLFVLRHYQLSEACARMAPFLSKAEEVLKEELKRRGGRAV